jgi:hypothetical protein
MPSGVITLTAVAKRTETLVVACSQCDRAERYRLAALIARHGPALGIPALLVMLSVDCPKRKSVRFYDLWGVHCDHCGGHCPELPALFNMPPA